MKKFYTVLLTLMLAAVMTGCVTAPTGTELGRVAQSVGMQNITTGDGTFENYNAVCYHRVSEIGIGVGLPLFGKFFELFPAASNEDLLEEVARECKAHGAEAMINVTPAQEQYWGFPFVIVGLYYDYADGTGIDLK